MYMQLRSRTLYVHVTVCTVLHIDHLHKWNLALQTRKCRLNPFCHIENLKLNFSLHTQIIFHRFYLVDSHAPFAAHDFLHIIFTVRHIEIFIQHKLVEEPLIHLICLDLSCYYFHASTPLLKHNIFINKLCLDHDIRVGRPLQYLLIFCRSNQVRVYIDGILCLVKFCFP